MKVFSKTITLWHVPGLTLIMLPFLTTQTLAGCDDECWHKIIHVVEPLNPVKLVVPALNFSLSLLSFSLGHIGPINEGEPGSIPPESGDPQDGTPTSKTPDQPSSNSPAIPWFESLGKGPYINPYAGMDTIGPPEGPCVAFCRENEFPEFQDGPTQDDLKRMHDERLRDLFKEIGGIEIVD